MLLHRYIGRSVLLSTIVVFLVFIGLEFFINFVGELSHVNGEQFSLAVASRYVLLSLPYQAYQLFPMVGLLGAVIGLGMLASRNELMVMRACGLSKWRISAAVMTSALAVMIVVTCIGETVGPKLMHIAQSNKTLADSGGQTLLTAQGVWLHAGDEFVHVGTVWSQDYLQEVLVYRFNAAHQLLSATHASAAIFLAGHWQLEYVTQSIFANGHVQRQTSRSLPWDVKLDSHMFVLGVEDPDELGLHALWQYIHTRERNGLESSQYSLSFWHRVLQPLATLVMMFLALPFVFGSLRGTTIGVRIFFSVIVGVAFYIINEFLAQLSLVMQLPAPVGVVLPIALFALCGLFFLYRAA